MPTTGQCRLNNPFDLNHQLYPLHQTPHSLAYNDLDKQIHGLLLHCVRLAKEGGMNQLLDHKIAYIMLRDKSPDYTRAFEHPEAMSILLNVVNGVEWRDWARNLIFMLPPDGGLHMRYNPPQTQY